MGPPIISHLLLDLIISVEFGLDPNEENFGLGSNLLFMSKPDSGLHMGSTRPDPDGRPCLACPKGLVNLPSINGTLTGWDEYENEGWRWVTPIPILFHLHDGYEKFSYQLLLTRFNFLITLK